MNHLKETVEKQTAEFNAAESLIQKIEQMTKGPSLKRLKKEVENVDEDLKALKKDINNAVYKAEKSVRTIYSLQFVQALNMYEIERSMNGRLDKYLIGSEMI